MKKIRGLIQKYEQSFKLMKAEKVAKKTAGGPDLGPENFEQPHLQKQAIISAGRRSNAPSVLPLQVKGKLNYKSSLDPAPRAFRSSEDSEKKSARSPPLTSTKDSAILDSVNVRKQNIAHTKSEESREVDNRVLSDSCAERNIGGKNNQEECQNYTEFMMKNTASVLERGLIKIELSPENVLITKSEPKLANDLNLSKISSTKITSNIKPIDLHHQVVSQTPEARATVAGTKNGSARKQENEIESTVSFSEDKKIETAAKVVDEKLMFPSSCQKEVEKKTTSLTSRSQYSNSKLLKLRAESLSALSEKKKSQKDLKPKPSHERDNQSMGKNDSDILTKNSTTSKRSSLMKMNHQAPINNHVNVKNDSQSSLIKSKSSIAPNNSESEIKIKREVQEPNLGLNSAALGHGDSQKLRHSRLPVPIQATRHLQSSEALDTKNLKGNPSPKPRSHIPVKSNRLYPNPHNPGVSLNKNAISTF
ncbi:hypothetical protein BY996DRAFT_6418196 [Phakopsora pachyrhizi]|nr:hypothetical protein BY996DRAFT_6418196 [Phakopsora pachyrhizi]